MVYLDMSKIKALMLEKGLREKRRITYQDIAEGTGLTWSTVERYANGRSKRPDPAKVALIAEYFEVDSEYFLSNEDESGNKKRANFAMEAAHSLNAVSG
jgi:transcriptional regulator with XRE-family HTH domain